MSKQSIDAMRYCRLCDEHTTDAVCACCDEPTMDEGEFENWQQERWEAQEEQKLADYHDGGSSFRTAQERHSEAYRQKRIARGERG